MITKVSIPEGAIEGRLATIASAATSSCFNTRRCDWRFSTFARATFINMFQYPKVRLKVLLKSACSLRSLVSIPEGAIEGPKHIVHPRHKAAVSIPEGAIEGFRASSTPVASMSFQYPKVRLKENSKVVLSNLLSGFNTRRCDWRGRCPELMHVRQQVSIPEGAIEGGRRCDCVLQERSCFNTRRCDWRSTPPVPFRPFASFQYPKVRLKGYHNLRH